MDSFHERLAHVGLAALAGYGFALAGGYAVQAHGLLERPSEDVDMFTTMAAEQAFSEAVRVAIAAYRAAGLDVELLVENDAFARLTVHDPFSGRNSKVELGIDWRQYPPTTHPLSWTSAPSWLATTLLPTTSAPCTHVVRPATTSTSMPP